MMNIAEAAAAAAKQQGRFKEYDHMGDGNSKQLTKTPQQNTLGGGIMALDIPFDVSEIKLFPVSLPSSDCFNFCCDEDIVELNWKIAHVADLSSLHLYTTKEKTRCELWAKMWSTSRVLAEILSGKRVSDHLTNMKVLEIGAGTAVCGMIAAFYGAKVTVTDSSEQSLVLAEKSSSLNQLEQKNFKTQRLNWHSVQDMPKIPSYELLIGSDVLFMEMNIASVVNVISAYLLPGGLAVILDPGRPCAEEFATQCEDKNLSVETMIIEDLVMGEGSLMKRAVLHLVSVEKNNISNRANFQTNACAKEGNVQLVKQSIIDSWGQISLERTISHDDDRVGMSYEYTEKFGE